MDSCPLCGSPNLQPAPLQPEPPFGLLQCGACGGIALSPRPLRSAMGAYYDAYYGSEASAQKSERQARRATRHFSRLARHARAGRLLEIGAGDGYFLDAARRAGWTVEGLELSQPRVARAQEWFNLELKCADLDHAPFPAESFDAICMFQLIEHVHDPRNVLQRVHRLLRPGGVMMISTPNVLAYSRKNRGVNTWRIPRHLFFFTPRTLVRTVESLGFDVLRRSLKLYATIEERLGWQPWPSSTLLSGVTRDLWTPFGLHLIARKK